jgi:ketosteroid isomerase-like protein
VLRDGGTTPLGLALDAARDRLWVAINYFPTTERAPRSDSGRAGVMSYDLASGRLLRRMELPRGPHQTGDICLAPNGDLYVSDGQGAVYAARAGADSLTLLVPPGTLLSAQGCAVDRDARTLFVADYLLGVAAVDVQSGRLTWLPHPPNTGYAGTDGLLLDGDRLIGVQNAWAPHRLLEMQLDRTHRAIIATRTLAQDTLRIDEPTHLLRLDGDVYFIENGGFSKYDDNGVLRPDVRQEAPRIGRIAAPHPLAVHADTALTKRMLLLADADLSRRADTAGQRAFLDAFATDGVLLAPGQPIVVPSTVRVSVLPASAPLGFSWRATNAIASTDGEFGCTYGSVTYARTETDSGPRGGVYATCWRHEADGHWAIVAHQHNARGSFGAGPSAMPRSATVAFPGDAGDEAQWTDAAFALFGSAPAGPAPAFTDFVADDGMLFAPPAFPSGPAAVARAFDGYPAERQLAWHPVYAFGRGGLALTVGNSETLTRATGVSQSPSKYLTLWRQRDDGRWEFVLDFGSPR